MSIDDADPWQQPCAACPHTLGEHTMGIVPSGPRECDVPGCECGQFVAAGGAPIPPREEWYRVVDAHHQGWHPTGSLDGPTVYAADYGFQREGLGDPRTLEQLEAERGPLRPVLPITPEDRAELDGALADAGRRAVYTIAVAVQDAFKQLRERHGGLANWDSYQRTRTHLLAGREGSWESEALIDLALWGDVDKTRRIHEPSRQVITDMIVRWVTDPDQYTEVAETLAGVVSRYADEHGGWKAVADQWLQPGSLDDEGVRVTTHLLYSQSQRFDELLG